MRIARTAALSSLLAAALMSTASSAAQSDPKPEEIVRSHVTRIGQTGARAARQSSVAEGPVVVKFLVGGSGSMTGDTLFFSQGAKLRLTLTFANQQYRGEDIVFDGDKFSVAYAGTHSYSPLGQFLHTYNSIVKEGLLGSVLSTAWPLLDPSSKGAKVTYAGLENVGDTKLHRLEYRPRRGQGEVRVHLFFEPSTFRHTRTEYQVRIPAPLNRSIGDTSATETHYRLVESFEDFETIDGLDLPRRWKLSFTISGRMGIEWEWDVRFKSVSTNQKIG
jgi:hypothetical protein